MGLNIVAMIRELLEEEEANGHFMLTSTERRAFQYEVMRRIESPTQPFTVIDKKTGEYPDLWKIALEEDWAKDLMFCDMEGFAVEEDGTLILMDECGRHEYAPENRFEIRFLDESEEL